MKNIDLANQVKKSLLIHTGILAILMAFVCVLIACNNNHLYTITTVSETEHEVIGKMNLSFALGMLLVTALYYAYYHIKNKNILSRVRYARLVAHLTGYLVVNIPLHWYAFFLLITNNSAIRGNENFLLSPDWFGVLFGMTSFWGFGLLIHLISSVANRGFEELQKS